MSINKIEFPTAGVPTVPTEYTNQNKYLKRNTKGRNLVSLTNWDGSPTAPQIALGSIIEVNGILWEADIDTAIITAGASGGFQYLVIDDSVPEFKLVDTAPIWSAALGGWYYVSGDRFTGHVVTWDGVSTYTKKQGTIDVGQASSLGAISPDGRLIYIGGVSPLWETHTINSFASAATGPSGATIYDSNLITCDNGAGGDIRIHTGVTSSISSSFASPGAAPSGLTMVGGNLISCDSGTNTIYVHSGISSTISTSFAAPGSNPFGLTTDGINLISCDSITGTIYIHTGVSSTISSSFASPGGAGATGLTFLNGDLVSCNNISGLIYFHKGATVSVRTRMNDTIGGQALGLAFDGNLIICDGTNNIIYHKGST